MDVGTYYKQVIVHETLTSDICSWHVFFHKQQAGENKNKTNERKYVGFKRDLTYRNETNLTPDSVFIWFESIVFLRKTFQGPQSKRTELEIHKETQCHFLSTYLLETLDFWPDEPMNSWPEGESSTMFNCNY